MAKKSAKATNYSVEEVYDLNMGNVWTVDAFQVASLWEATRQREGSISREEKLLNVIRSAFIMQTFDPEDEEEAAKYNNGEWATFSRSDASLGNVAIQRKPIKRLGDLTKDNINTISAATLIELIDRNFGGGWESIPANIRDIIEIGFDISTTQLPTSRIHMPNGPVDRKTKAGYEVYENARGNWTEAIFAKKKELTPIIEEDDDDKDKFDDDTAPIYDEDVDNDMEGGEEEDDEAAFNDDSEFYSNFSEDGLGDGDVDDELRDGFMIEGE